MQKLPPLLAALSLSAPLAAQQQFDLQTGPAAIPGTPRWSEGVEAADVDADGDLDLFFADGEGFTTPGTKRQNVLVVNRFETTPGTFADESVARLGAHASNAKMVTTGDVQDDGYVDALFCNAFGTDLPFLYVNDPGTPGFFTFEGAARGFTTAYSSGSGQLGDVDDDGDLDVLLSDAYLGGGSGKPHLYRNDGLGFFAEDAAFQAAAPAKSAQMDVQLVDLEGDFDLDFVGICRAENGTAGAGDHYVMLNDGTGAFADASGLLPDGNSNGVYEGEVGDLDGDDDLDLFIVSISGFADGPLRNTRVPGGSLGWVLGPGIGGDDDNEVAFLDFDNDGDYDPFIGSLGGGGEKVFVNDAGFTPDGLLVQGVADSTLDMTVADLDNDGAYDLVTAQGESSSAQWANKWYRNNGAPDSLAPVVVREEPLGVTGAPGSWKVRAGIRDQVLDDGKDWVASDVAYVVLSAPQELALDVTAGGFSSALASVAAGTTVTWTNQDALAHSVTSTTPGYAFDSGPLASGESFAHTFVGQLAYDYADAVGGLAAAQVEVTSAPTPGEARASGGGVHRFAMSDTSGGTGIALAYELGFTDWAGNRTVTESRRVPLGSVALRNGGTNPASYAVERPVLGATIQATVDLATTGHSLALPFAFDSPAALTLAGGQTLLALDLGGSGELLGLSSAAGPLAQFALPVPPDPALLGFTAYSQALQLGGVTPFALSNAQDLQLGL